MVGRKDIFKYSRRFIGGTPAVYAYYTEDKLKSIDIMTSKDTQFTDVDVHSTIGLSEIDINKSLSGKRVGVELIAVGDKGKETICNILASVAFEIMDEHDCYFGKVFSDAISKYDNGLAMKHAILLSPAFWNQYKQMSSEDMIVTWLLLVPLSDMEKEYVEKFGVDEFEELLAKQDVDITDINRKSFVI